MRDVNVEEGKALTFTASFDMVPAFDPAIRDDRAAPAASAVDDDAVDQALERLRERAGAVRAGRRRGVVDGDTR